MATHRPRTRRTCRCRSRISSFSRVEERRVAGRGRWLIRRFRNRAAGRVPWVRFLPPLSEPGGPISGTGLSSGIMRLAHGIPGHDQRTGLASPGTRLAPLRRPAGASSGLLTPWRRRPLGSPPSLVHVVTSGIPGQRVRLGVVRIALAAVAARHQEPGKQVAPPPKERPGERRRGPRWPAATAMACFVFFTPLLCFRAFPAD